MSATERTPIRSVLVLSAFVHLALFAWAARTPRPHPLEASPMAELHVEDEVEIEAPVVEPQVVPTPETPATEPAPAAAVVAAVATRSNGGGGGAVEGGPASTAPAAASAQTEPLAGANTNWVVNLGPGVGPAYDPKTAGGAHNPFVSRQVAEAEERAATGPRKDNGLKGALMAADAAKGLGPDGPVLRALESETRTSLAPVQGNATFRAIVDAMGNVTSLHVVESTGDSAGWDDARARAFAALQKKKLTNVGSGATIDIRVESEMRLPSGATSKIDLSGGPLTMRGDLADLASKPSRVIHARTTKITPL